MLIDPPAQRNNRNCVTRDGLAGRGIAALICCMILLLSSPLWSQSQREYIYMDGRLISVETTQSDNPIPILDAIDPTSGTAGGSSFTLTANGSNFVSASIIRWNGSNRTTTYISPGQLTATILSTDIASAGTASVTVYNPAPGGGISNAKTFTISTPDNPVPTPTSINPTTRTAGGSGFTLWVNGSGFIPGSIVRWNGSNRTTTYVSAIQVRATISSSDIASAGTVSVTVFNPPPGGGTSTALTLTISPSTYGLDPFSKTAGDPSFQLSVYGNGFLSSSVVRWNGGNRTTSYVSANQLNATISSSDIASAGTASVAVYNPPPGGGLSNSQTFTIDPPSNPEPTSMTFSSSSGFAGISCVTITVGNGANMVVDLLYDWTPWGSTSTVVDIITPIGPMDGQGQLNFCFGHDSAAGVYTYRAIRNNAFGASWTYITPIEFTMRPPKPTSFSVTPRYLQLPSPAGAQVAYAGNSQGETIEEHVYIPGIGHGYFELPMDSSGYWYAGPIDCSPPTGTYTFYKVRNALDDLSGAWLEFGIFPKLQTLQPCP